MKRIHVIIPCYNVEKYLEQAVTSVLDQPFKDLDIVLVDDGSPGKTPEICDMLAEKTPNIHVIHQTNAGVSAARNAGINYILKKYANDLSGRYIAFLDADDGWEKDFLTPDTVTLLDGKYDLVGFQSRTCNAGMERKGAATALQTGAFAGNSMNVWLHSSQHFGAMMYACGLLDQYSIRFQNGLKYSEDKMFSLTCMYLANRIWLENKVMYLYRIVVSSAMGTRKFGIPYYQPIIDGYLRMDREMERWENPSRGKLTAGRACASHYTVCMMEEHFQNWRPKREVDRCLAEHPEYVDVMKRKPPYEYLPRNLRYEAYERNPKKFILKHNLLGIGEFIRRTIARVWKYLN